VSQRADGEPDLGRPPLPEDFEVFVESIDEQGRATYISGFFEFKKSRFKFDAIAMEGYGGPNIAATLAEDTLSALRRMELDESQIDELITTLQRKIMEGGAHIQLRKNDSEEGSKGISKTNGG
jgi:hypothetical protein